MNLFEQNAKKLNIPLAERMKPRSFADFIGQEHILGKESRLSKLIEKDALSSMILYGPSGTGKTSIARIVASSTKSDFITLNAVTSGVKEVKEAVERAENNKLLYAKKTILFIDEIHRFNKLQQDALLPYVESGHFILIGATTENPFYEINSALLSRTLIFKLDLLSEADIVDILKRAVDSDEGLAIYNVKASDEVLSYIAKIASGDARKALNLLELVVLSKSGLEDELEILPEDIEVYGFRKYDRTDSHYDYISAFIKSMRGSDPDATVFYLAMMLLGGEDPLFIARRILICASEDVGNADPMALVIANSAFEAVKVLGMPEARIILSQAAIYIANAPKSNSTYMAINLAMSRLKDVGEIEVPSYLKDGTANMLKEKFRQSGNTEGFGETREYMYPHDYEGGYVEQQYLPDAFVGAKFYFPKNIKSKE